MKKLLFAALLVASPAMAETTCEGKQEAASIALNVRLAGGNPTQATEQILAADLPVDDALVPTVVHVSFMTMLPQTAWGQRKLFESLCR